MATTYQAPGVYIEERDTGPKPIEGVATAIPVFIGFTEKAPQDKLNKPVLITNWQQYEENFGGYLKDAYLPLAIRGFYDNAGTTARCYVMSVRTSSRATGLLNVESAKALPAPASALPKPGDEGEKPKKPSSRSTAKSESYKLDVTAKNAGDQDNLRIVIEPDEFSSFEQKRINDEDLNISQPFTITIERQRKNNWQPVAQERHEVVLVEEKDNNGEVEVLLKDRYELRQDFISGLVDINTAPLANISVKDFQLKATTSQPLRLGKQAHQPETTDDIDYYGKLSERTGIESLQTLDDATMICIPDLMTNGVDDFSIVSVQKKIMAHCRAMGDRVAILDAPKGKKAQEIKEWLQGKAKHDSDYATLYYPWVEVENPLTKKPVLIPPSGHVAGIWARNDKNRGVHKAPANEILEGVVSLEREVTHGEQESLNPIGINCIRAFPSQGIRVWGARTLSSNPSWRYLNVRRLFNYVEKSIERSTQWVVFEPNNHDLWARIRRDVTQFLRVLWGQGALYGTSEEEAFFVKCDGELNPRETQQLGQLFIRVGLAPVFPAEFVVFQFEQKTIEAQ